ncbi:hypothetical protein BGX38DRAFT_1144756 [Terfezia claveryi]|nr:hypothetical protein BGX38DRAFT_1144756 [Terfezia claveryi]
MFGQSKIFIILQGIVDEFLVLEIAKNLHQFFKDNICVMADYSQLDTERILLNAEIQAYNVVEILVLDQNIDDKNSYQLHSEGILYIQEFKHGGGQMIVWLYSIKGAAYLILVELALE